MKTVDIFFYIILTFIQNITYLSYFNESLCRLFLLQVR